MNPEFNLKRLKKLTTRLIADGHARNQRELAAKLGYTESSFSQILNGKVAISKFFIKKLYEMAPNINETWLLTGEGEMLNTPSSASEPEQDQPSMITIPANVWSVIEKQANSLNARDKQIGDLLEARERQIDELISIIKEEVKKTDARREDRVTSAAAG